MNINVMKFSTLITNLFGIYFFNVRSFSLKLNITQQTVTEPTIPFSLIRPKVILFDADYTLWPFSFDLDVTFPIYIKENKEKNIVLDDAGKHLKMYRQVPGILEYLQNRGHKLGVISQTRYNITFMRLLELFDINRYFTFKEVYPIPKQRHIEIINLKSDIDFGDMLYFDDEYKEIPDVADLTTVPILIGDEGVTMEDIRKGLHIFSTAEPPDYYSTDEDFSSLSQDD